MYFNSSMVTVRVWFGTGLDTSCGPLFESVKSSNSSPHNSLGIGQHPCSLFLSYLNQIPCDEVCFRYHKTYFAAFIWLADGLLLNWLSKLYTVLISGRVFMLNQFKQPIFDWYSWIKPSFFGFGFVVMLYTIYFETWLIWRSCFFAMI